MLPPGFSYVLLFQERGPVLLRYLRRRTAPLPGTLRWGDFLGGQKVTKDPPKAGPSPALWNPPRGTGCTCVLLVSALVLDGSHRWHGDTIDSTYFSAGWCFYTPGPYPGKAAVSSCRWPGSRRRQRRLSREARSWKPPSHRASFPGWPGVVAQTGATARVTGRVST